MKAKRLSLPLAVLLAVGGLWFAGSAWRNHTQRVTRDAPDAASHETGMDAGSKLTADRPQPGQTLLPPNPNRRFEELTPEQRVRRARKGPVGG